MLNSSIQIDSGFCSRLVLCNIYKLFFIMGGRFVVLLSSEGVRIADNESMG